MMAAKTFFATILALIGCRTVAQRKRAVAETDLAMELANPVANLISDTVQHPCRLPWRTLAFLLVIGFLLSGVAHGGDTAADGIKTIVGNVWYRERMRLPPHSEIHITLEDVARADAPAERIAATHFMPQGGPPWAFSMEYEPMKLNDRGRYVLRARIETDGRLLFTSTEHIPAFGRDPTVPVEIMVSRVAGPRRGGGVAPPKPPASLTNTYWKLAELNGQKATLGARQRELHMVLTSDGERVRGFSGCNRFSGTYDLSNGQLRFQQLASTMVACVEGMEQERQFVDALKSTARFSLSGDALTLYGDQDQLILRFEAVYLR